MAVVKLGRACSPSRANVRGVPDVRLQEVEPGDVGDRKVLAFSGYPDLRPFSRGNGSLNVLCARCSFVLIEAAMSQDLAAAGLLIRCPACGALNSPPPALPDEAASAP